jgi:signal transduction histidine kinase
MSSIRTRLLLALAVSVAMTLAMASVLSFGAQGLAEQAETTREANDEIRDLLSFALVAHRYMGAFAQSLGQRTLVANNERRIAGKQFQERIAAIPTHGGSRFGAELPWSILRTISADLLSELERADQLRAAGKFYDAEHTFNLARREYFEHQMLPWFESAIEAERTEVGALEAAALKKATTLRFAGRVLGVSSAALAGLSALALLRAVIRPVRLLVQGTEAIARGDLSHRIAYEGVDELGVLALRFNDMADVVEKSRGTLIEHNTVLEEAYRLQSEFLSIVSHELRSPLNSIIGYTELVLEDGHELSAQGKKNVTSIATGARRLLSLINDILDFSRLRAGRMQARVEPFRISELCSLVVEDGRALAQGRPIEIVLEERSDLSEMISDETKVRQILTNLVSNSVKFTDRGAVTLTVSETEAEVTFSVKDTGIGIPAEQLDAVFEPFRQAHGVDRRAVSGTGLGLAIVKRLSDLLGGSVFGHSVVGKGTEFTVVLPRRLESDHGQDPDHR